MLLYVVVVVIAAAVVLLFWQGSLQYENVGVCLVILVLVVY